MIWRSKSESGLILFSHGRSSTSPLFFVFYSRLSQRRVVVRPVVEALQPEVEEDHLPLPTNRNARPSLIFRNMSTNESESSLRAVEKVISVVCPCIVLMSLIVTGVLKGYDQLLNLVLDEVEEELLEPTIHTRTLGLSVLRGPTITIVSPVDGSEEIANPFAAPEG